MRNLLAAAVAIAPLIAASGAQAEIVITSARTTPITTANATGTGPDNIRIGDKGAINVTSGVAVTVNSNHGLDIDSGGAITMTNAASGATAVLINNATVGPIIIGGAINVTDDIDTYPDTDSDGDLDGPWANGTDRYGVRVAGPATVTGNLSQELSGTIAVDGNQSYGVSIEADLVGDVQILGQVRAIGTDSIAFRTTGDVTGDVTLAGSINASGEGAEAIDIGGDISGRLTVQSNVAVTGYRYVTRGTDAAVAKLDPDDLLQGGSALVVAGNVAGGVVLDGPPDDTDPNNADEDNDGIPDATETLANVIAYGSAPAVLIGSDSRDITLGVAGTGADAYGFINRGAISAEGVYDAVDTHAMRIGGTGHAVTIDGGILNQGSIQSLATAANGVALQIGDGASTPALVNEASISSTAISAEQQTSTAIQIDAGANLGRIANSSQIVAGGLGPKIDAVAIRDLSGSLGLIENSGTISAGQTVLTTTETITGTAIAIDASANTTGLTLIQSGGSGTPTTDDPDTDGDGVPDSREPKIVGDVLLGSGADHLDIRNGRVTGAIDFGSGADRLDISGGSEVRAALSSSDGQLAVNLTQGLLETRQAGQVDVSSLNIGSDSTLLVTIDPENNSNSGFNVSGAADVQSGATLGVRFASLLTGPEQFDIITANSLTVGTIDQSLVQANSPYLFVVSAAADPAAGRLYVDARRRTASEAGLTGVETGAFDAVYEALGSSTALRDAYLAQTGRDGFINLYEQMLPDHSGGPLLSLASGVDAVTRALTGRNASAAPGETSAWVQEINFYADKDRTDTYGFRSEGFGVAGGIERGTSAGAFGLSVAFTSSDLEDPEAEAEEVLSASLIELGLYWRAQGQYWTTWARAAAGYATFDATRQLVGESLNLRNESSWNGFTLAAAAGASYERHHGKWNIRPEIYAEYFSLSEDARIEKGGGDGFDLDIDERDGHIFSAVAAINVGYGFGQNGWLRPELRLGWRQNISVDPGETIARFAAGGPDFMLSPMDIKGGGPIAGFRLSVGNELGMLTISADAEKLEDYIRYTLLLRASFRF